MNLYNLTLQKAGFVQIAVYGNFSDSRIQEIALSRGKTLELLRPIENAPSGNALKIHVTNSTEVYGQIRSMVSFRVPGLDIDHLIVGSDSGRIVILRWNNVKYSWQKIHQETFGKTGCRRIVPGQFLAAEAYGRACMIASMEKNKLVYILNRDSAGNIAISSPQEANKNRMLCFGITALDTGFENPTFAALELDYTELDDDSTGEATLEAQKHLTIYELDLGINSCTRKNSEPIDNGSNILITVPGGFDGPGGVLVCSENIIYYRSTELKYELRVLIPRRFNQPKNQSVLITCYSSFKNKKYGFFILLQSEFGDLYKLTLKYLEESDKVVDMVVKYFDSIKPCISLCIMKTGYLFAASEFGNHMLYKFVGLGEGENIEVSISAMLDNYLKTHKPVFFRPKDLSNLELVDEMSSLSPIIDMKIENILSEETPQIFIACGRGTMSTLRLLRPGISVAESVSADLPDLPQDVFTLKATQQDTIDKYLVISYNYYTMVLVIFDGTVNQIIDSGIQSDVSTVCVQLMADDSFVQVHSQGVRHILSDKRIHEWSAPARKNVEKAACNNRQIVLSLSGGEIVYLELDIQAQQLVERAKKDLNDEVLAIDICPIKEGVEQAGLFAVADSHSTVRLFSLEPGSLFGQVSVQHTEAANATSLLFMDFKIVNSSNKEPHIKDSLTLQIGLSSGVLLRVEVDRGIGQLKDKRWRFLGLQPPKLVSVITRGRRALIALSKRPWLGYISLGKYFLSPLCYETVDSVASFATKENSEGFVAVVGSKHEGVRGKLRFIQLERLGVNFSQQTTNLRYTPRSILVHSDAKTLIVCESDNCTQSELLDPNSKIGKKYFKDSIKTKLVKEKGINEELGNYMDDSSHWFSCLRIVDPRKMESIFCVELDIGEAVVSTSLLLVDEQNKFIAVGVARNLRLAPRRADGWFIRVYRIRVDGRHLEQLHTTEVEDLPAALSSYHGRLLVGVGSILRMYDIGKKRVLRKSEYKHLPNLIISIKHLGKRIYIADIQESIFFMKFRQKHNEFYIYADDTIPRYITALCLVDYDTVAVGDKFGNVVILRLPSDVSSRIEEDLTAGKAFQTSDTNKNHFKVEAICNFHVGDVVTSLQKETLQPGGCEGIIYSTIGGSLAVLLPITYMEEADFFQHLEMHMRQEAPPLLGQDHMAFRSYYIPCRKVIDGDLCEAFAILGSGKQELIAEGLDRKPGDVQNKIEETRNKVI
jgi:splicing factor 3B subunit 3